MLTKIAVSCDEYGQLVDVLLALLRKRGYEPIYFGPHAGKKHMIGLWLLSKRLIRYSRVRLQRLL